MSDPCCGTGGFLAEAAEHMRRQAGDFSTAQLEALKHRTFYGREKDSLAYPIALANLMLHGIDEPHIWHGNTLSRQVTYDGLYAGAPDKFNVVLTNPPFGDKEGSEAQAQFPFKTRATHHDLKAVNPRERKTSDARTPLQLLEAIDAQGHQVDQALARLRDLLEAPPAA